MPFCPLLPYHEIELEKRELVHKHRASQKLPKGEVQEGVSPSAFSFSQGLLRSPVHKDEES
jgi:hypothetical protein